ncbi:MAG TPA: hypothetical protein VF120_08245 [Ktedonobacterales bacterium]
MPLLVAAILGLSAAAFVLYPLLAPRVQAAHRGAGDYLDATTRERAAKDALRELDFDYRLGNLEDADYQALRQRYEERAVSALHSRYTYEHELDARIDRELAALGERGAHSDGHLATGKTSRSATTRRTSGATRRRRDTGGGNRG